MLSIWRILIYSPNWIMANVLFLPFNALLQCSIRDQIHQQGTIKIISFFTLRRTKINEASQNC